MSPQLFAIVFGFSTTISLLSGVATGTFLGLNIALCFYLFVRFSASRLFLQFNTALLVLFTAFLFAGMEFGSYNFRELGDDFDIKSISLLLSGGIGFTVLMILRYVTNAFENHGITDTALATAFGFVVFVTVLGPYLDSRIFLTIAILVIFFVAIFTTSFSIWVKNRCIEGGKRIIVATVILLVIIGSGLMGYEADAIPAYFYNLIAPVVITLINLFLTIFVAPVGESVSSENTVLATNEVSAGHMAKLMAKDRMKDEYMSMVAHELRTPLGGIISISELLSDGGEGDVSQSVKTNLSLIAQSGRRLNYLLNDLLDISKDQNQVLTINPEPVHLRSVINKVMALQNLNSSQKDIELKNNVSRDIANVMADPDKLEQILHNLINNSVKFTNEGYVAVDADVSGDKITITIEDTGQGLSKENLDKILESFSDDVLIPGESLRGSGLGLKICNRLIDLHGSKLTMESVEGFGSYFYFSLDKTDAEANINDDFENYALTRRREDSVLTGIRPHRNARLSKVYEIMVVDDESINLKVLNAQLSRAGYTPICLESGKEALEHIRTKGLPDLILLDIMMPVMNGFEVCKEIRTEFSPIELPVIMLTAKNHINDILEAFKCGANDYIAKPIAKDELLARLRTQLELSKINHAFSRFVPHEFLKYLGYESIMDIKLGDQVEESMTVLFSDIKDFTRISEKMSPKESFDFINTFLGVVSPIIRESGGFVDKFIGDAVMALFPGGADDAVKAAIRMTNELKIINKQREASGLEPMRIGTGLHSGKLMLGTIGEEQRMEGTVISDVVNTASRMEGLTKLYNSSVVISSETKSQLTSEEGLHFRYLGKTRVRGKNEVLNVFGIIEGDDDDVIKLELESAQVFEAGVNEFYDKNFTKASVHFNEVLKANPNDKAANIFLKRSAHLMITGVPEDWSGVDESMILLEQQL